MIEIKNVNKSFGKQQVLKNVSLECQEGQITGIVGHNGSGKTVLFKCICGLLFIDEGEIIIDGKKQRRDGGTIKNAGIIIENPAFLENETAVNNLKYLYEINHKRDDQLISAVLETVGLEPKQKKRVKNFSLGMKQRLAIAQAIMENPKILILDEPMNGLDKNGVKEMRKIFTNEKKKGKTILLASHNKEDIDILCEHVYEMEDGIIEQIR
jgi:ABC-2 type transport system ATP-binding protein